MDTARKGWARGAERTTGSEPVWGRRGNASAQIEDPADRSRILITDFAGRRWLAPVRSSALARAIAGVEESAPAVVGWPEGVSVQRVVDLIARVDDIVGASITEHAPRDNADLAHDAEVARCIGGALCR